MICREEKARQEGTTPQSPRPPVCESFIKVSQSQPDVLGRSRSRSLGLKEESLFLGLERRGTLVRRASSLAAAAALDGERGGGWGIIPQLWAPRGPRSNSRAAQVKLRDGAVP